MTINHIEGDAFTTTAPIIAHGVNIVGNMGGGFAAVVRKKWGETVYEPYVAACDADELQLGEVLVTEAEPGLFVYNLASQHFPGADARLDALEQSLREAVRVAKEAGFNHMAMPRIGAGIGGLKLEDVFSVLDKVDAENPDFMIDVYFFPEPPIKKKVREISSLFGGANG